MNRIIKLFALLISSALFSLLTHHSMAQSSWEGKFMDQFHVKVSFDGLGTGIIKMYDGDHEIQNDGLIKVVINESEITFNIPAKQTDFKGKLLESGQLISGNFVFPDGTLHPLQLHEVIPKVENNYLLSSTEAVTDLLQLYTAIKETHPDPFRYITPKEFDKLYSITTHLEEENIPVEDFYLKAAQLTGAIKCSHTGLRLPADMVAEITHEFPLNVFYTDDQLYVLESPAPDIKPGSQITRINGRNTMDILADLKLMIPVNGNNTTTKGNVLNRKFRSMLPLLDDAEEYTLEFRNDGALSTVIVPAKTRSWVEPDETGQPTYEPKSEDLAYIKIPTFGIRNMDEYMASLDKIFTDLNNLKVKNLVVDLRDNSGGHPIFAAQLLSYLTDQTFTYFKRNPDIPDFEPLYNPMQPNARAYQGNLYVFINGGCLSTSGHLISLLKQYTSAKFIGEEPGSTYRCNDFSMKVDLANSNLEFNLPRTVFETKVDGEATKVPFPVDYKVEETLNDKLAGRDVYWKALATAMEAGEVY